MSSAQRRVITTQYTQTRRRSFARNPSWAVDGRAAGGGGVCFAIRGRPVVRYYSIIYVRLFTVYSCRVGIYSLLATRQYRNGGGEGRVRVPSVYPRVTQCHFVHQIRSGKLRFCYIGNRHAIHVAAQPDGLYTPRFRHEVSPSTVAVHITVPDL